MPTYDYKCKECGEKFEKKLPIADYLEAQICPKCGGGSEKQVPCAALKGVG